MGGAVHLIGRSPCLEAEAQEGEDGWVCFVLACSNLIHITLVVLI